MIDVATLHRIVKQMKQDASSDMSGLNMATISNIAHLIEEALGAPVTQPTREQGAAEADKLYPSSPSQRLAFNDGVRWTLESMARPLYGVDK